MDGTMSTKQEQSSKVEGSGRKRGTPNKTTKLMKESILLAAERSGQAMVEKLYGQSEEEADQRFVEQARKDGMTAYLQIMAEAQPTAFMSLMGKVLPLQVKADIDGEIDHVVRVEWQPPH
jgi:predicted ribonuclease YlaK